MLPTKFLLALSSLLLVRAYKIEIDVQDDSKIQMNDQISVTDDEPTFNATVDGPEGQQLGPFGCPGTCAGSATCKAGDKSIRIASDGSPFYLHCGMGIYNAQYNKNELIEPSFESCIDRCAEMSWCMAANYEPASKKCWRLSSYNFPGGVNENWEAALKMTTARKSTASCPENDGHVIKTTYRTYKLYCDYDLPGSELLSADLETFEGAAERCDTISGCGAVVRNPKNNKCSFKSTFAVPPKDPTKADKTVALLIPVSGLSGKPCCGQAKGTSDVKFGRYDEL